MAWFWQYLLGWDPGKVVSGTDWTIEFVAKHSNYFLLGMVLVLAALAYLTIRSYRREGEAPRRAKATLAALRIAVIVLLIAIFFNPTITFTKWEGHTLPIVVLLDDSNSMGFKDHYSADGVAEQKALLMRDLGVNAADLAQKTRSYIASKEVLKALERLSIDHPLIFVRFSVAGRPGSRGSSIDRVQPEGATQPDPNAGAEIEKMLSGWTTVGNSTDLPGAIYNVLGGTRGERVGAIVMISDGQMTVGSSGSAISGARENAIASGVQLYTMMVGDPTPPKRLSVIGLQAPDEARCGAEVEFTVSLAHRNMEGERITVKLQRRKVTGDANEPWGEAIVSESVTLEKSSSDPNLASRDLRPVVMRTKPGGASSDSNLPGKYEYKASIAPLPEGEAASEGFKLATVRVVEDKIRVLLVSGDAGKEFQYLRNYFHRMDEDYLVSVWQQNADPNVNQAASTGMKLERLPRELDELIGVPGNKDKPGYNVVILYDPQETEGGFDQHFVEDLLKPFVEKHRGGLCYIAGNKHSDQVLGMDPNFAALREMMAVNIAPNTLDIEHMGESKTEAWQVQLTTLYGLDHPITRLGRTAEDSHGLWADLPGIYWSHPVAKPKPAARVLAVSGDPVKHATLHDDPLPLIAVQRFGTGSVLYIGFDETWRWMPVKDGLYHRNFWGNVVRYLASLQARRVTITTGGDSFKPGEDIPVEVQAYDESYRELKKDFVYVVMTTGPRNAREVVRPPSPLKLLPVEGRPGQFKANLKADREGTFELFADVKSEEPKDALDPNRINPGDPNEAPAEKRIDIKLPDDESRRTEADPDTLKGLAWPQDRFLDISDGYRLYDPNYEVAIASGRWPSKNREEKGLWDTNMMLLAIVVLLAIEWILRKKYNMA